jgi:hypothetical protein
MHDRQSYSSYHFVLRARFRLNVIVDRLNGVLFASIHSCCSRLEVHFLARDYKFTFLKMSDVTITECFLISSESMKRKVRVDKAFTKEVDDRRFIQIATHLVYAPSLFANGHPTRALAFTDVFETLTKLRNAEFDKYEESKKPPKLEIHGVDIPNPKRRQVDPEAKIAFPKTITIEAPAYGPIQSTSMTIMTNWKRSVPLYVELTGENLQYLMDVCNYQIGVGDKKRQSKPPKKLKSKSTSDQCDEVDEHTDSEAGDEANDEVDAKADGESPIAENKCDIDVEKDCEQMTSPKATISIAINNSRQSELAQYFRSPK